MNLYLIGYRGSGKSTVAPIVARLLNAGGETWATVDSDDVVEADAKMSIAEIFSSYGEAYFRKLESETIAKISVLGSKVVSLGGGAPINSANQDVIRRTGKVVYLVGEPELLWQRIYGDETSFDRRPDLTDKGGMAEIVSLLEIRHPIYDGCADYRVEIAGLSPEEIAERIVRWLHSDDKD